MGIEGVGASFVQSLVTRLQGPERPEPVAQALEPEKFKAVVADAVKAHGGASSMEVSAASSGGSSPVQQHARQIAKATETSLENGVQLLETLLRDNPDPTYRAELLTAARPSLEEMGRKFVAPAKSGKAVDMIADDTMKRRVIDGLTRSAELAGDSGAATLGEAFARWLPEGMVQPGLVLGDAVTQALKSGHGSRFAFELVKGLNLPANKGGQARGGDAIRLLDATWKAIGEVRTQFDTLDKQLKGLSEELAKMMSNNGLALTAEQQKRVLSTFRGQHPEFAQHEAAVTSMLTMLDGVRAAQGDSRAMLRKSDAANALSMLNELPRLAQTPAGADRLARELKAFGDKKPSILDAVLPLGAKGKDLKDLADKWAPVLITAAGADALALTSTGNKKAVDTLFAGLTRCAPLFGLDQKEMSSVVKEMRAFKPGWSQTRVDDQVKKISGMLGNLTTGTPGFEPSSVPGQSLRGLGLVLSGLALTDGLAKQDKTFADKMKAVGDGLSLTGDGVSFALDMLGKTSRLAKAAGPLGTFIGGVADSLTTLDLIQEGKLAEATASGASGLGGILMGVSAVAGGAALAVTGGVLVVAGLGLKLFNEQRKDQAFRREQRELYAASGFQEPLLGALVDANPERVSELNGKLGLSPEQIQKLSTTMPSLMTKKWDDAKGLHGSFTLERMERLCTTFGFSGDELFQMLDQGIQKSGGDPARNMFLFLENVDRMISTDNYNTKDEWRAHFRELARYEPGSDVSRVFSLAEKYLA